MRERVFLLAAVLTLSACADSARPLVHPGNSAAAVPDNAIQDKRHASDESTAVGPPGRESTRVDLINANATGGTEVAKRKAVAANKYKPKHQGYQPPIGFNGHAWDEPLSEFVRLAADPLFVQTAYSRGKKTLIDMQCVPRGNNPCELEATLRTLHQKVEGEGFHALAEYYVKSQGFHFRSTGATLFPVFYQFCANWGGFADEIPADIKDRMRFCGLRMLFRSETLEALREHDDEYVTNYERVLQELIDRHGEPDGYRKRGRVIIQTPNERIAQPRKRRFDEWRWCRLRGDRDIAPNCKASVVLAFDPSSGWGVVLYATRPVWEFAYARHNGGAENDPLYKLLRGIDKYHPVDDDCIGTHLCRPDPPRKMSEETLARFRLPSTEPRAAP